MNGKALFIAFVVSLGGFLFGFDAGIISGVVTYVAPQFNLNDMQTGWVVSSPTFSAMFAMLVSGRLSDMVGRKKILVVVAFLYTLSAMLSAYANSYEILYIARMIGGLAFGAALILAPTYISEISTPENRGKLVSIQQLNIVLGFFAAFLSNYYFNKNFTAGESEFLTQENVWRWMLGVECFPALLYFVLLFFIPRSPRWLFMKGKNQEAKKVLVGLFGEPIVSQEEETILNNLNKSEAKTNEDKVDLAYLFKPALRFVIFLGLVIGILQQVTGINAIYFYATSIFKQTGIGTDAAFSSGVLLSFTTVVFTILAMFLIDKLGRRPLLIVGVGGIALSLLLCAYGFYGATYQLTSQSINKFTFEEKSSLKSIENKVYDSDVDFKREIKLALGNQVYAQHEGAILEEAISMNATLVLVGVLCFIACFAFSLGPVMWVMLSELYPNRIRGLAIGMIGFVNSFASWFVQQVFPWELTNFGNATTFFIFGIIALIGFFLFLKILPETKGKSLEELEQELIATPQ